MYRRALSDLPQQKVDGVTVDVPIVSIIEKQGANAPIEVQNYIRQFAQQL